MTEFKINRGLSSNLPSKLTDGWVYFCTDTGEMYTDCIDNGILRRKKIKSLDALQKSGGTMEGALKFTSQKHFGTATPSMAEEGQVFFLNSDNGIEDKNALKKAGDTMEGVLRFTDGIHFGDAEPEIGDEGQIYFVEGEGGGEAVKPFAVIGVEYPAGSVCTCTSSDGATVLTADDDGGKFIFFVPRADTWTVGYTGGGKTVTENIIVTDELQCFNVVLNRYSNLNECTWAEISEISASGQAQNYWSVGDCKAVDLYGRIGAFLSVDTALYVYIIGFDHNGATNTIDFGTFKTAPEGGVDVCLVDSKYGTTSTTGALCFNTDHYKGNDFNNKGYGGWKACDLRYDILGSTDLPSSEYKIETITGNRVGYDATSTCATHPVANTLMAALPADLRAVMKPMEIWTDNSAIDYTISAITSSIDYLPLLSEFEIYGARRNAHSLEHTYQEQYPYYIYGNSAIKFSHSDITLPVTWWTRSQDSMAGNHYVNIYTDGVTNAAYVGASSSGIAPIFRV